MHLNVKLIFVLGTALLLQSGWVVAQTLMPVTGITFNNKTSGRVAQVNITNLQHPVKALSNDQGTFTINAAVNDTLLFVKPGFTEQKLVVTQNQMLVFLVPSLVLDDVIVRAQTKKQEQQDVMNTYRSKGLYYDGKPPVLAVLAHPLAGLYEMFSKDAGRARHFSEVMKRENQQTEVNKRYTREMVKRITKLPDDEISTFMLNYSPPYPAVLKWNDYEIIQFINRSLAAYRVTKAPSADLNAKPANP